MKHDKKNLYGTGFNYPTESYVSYSLKNATDIQFEKHVEAEGNCKPLRAIYVTAADKPPYAVYGVPYGGSAGCGVVMSVEQNGTLSKVIQNYNYNNNSVAHGLAFDLNNTFMYSADHQDSLLWTHKVNRETGEVVEVSKIPGPSPKSDPRHVTVHPNGQYLYVVLEGSNEVAQYAINATDGTPSEITASDTDSIFPLLPRGSNNTAYWGDEIALSSSNKYLWATTRAFNANETGYISALSLDSTTGKITAQLFLTPTTNSGGLANAVTPSPFTDEFVALTDSSAGMVQIWKFYEGRKSAEVVAIANIQDGACCANAVWYD